MKRLVWLLLAAWCTAIAQVQPVAPLVPAECSDCCCDCSGGCGMPECVALPVSPAPTALLERPATVARPAARADAVATAALLEKFFVIYAGPAVAPEPVPAPADGPPPAGVPLFREHCALLI